MSFCDRDCQLARIKVGNTVFSVPIFRHAVWKRLRPSLQLQAGHGIQPRLHPTPPRLHTTPSPATKKQQLCRRNGQGAIQRRETPDWLTSVFQEESCEAHDHVVLLGCWELRERHSDG